MLRVRPGVLLVRANFDPTRELITLDFPTFDRPRNAISGTPGAGKCVKSLADSMNRDRIRIQTVSVFGLRKASAGEKISSQENVPENGTDKPAEAEQLRGSPAGAIQPGPAFQPGKIDRKHSNPAGTAQWSTS